MYFIFQPHLTCAPALPGETRNPKIASFHLKAACFLPKTHNTLKYHLVTAEPPFTNQNDRLDAQDRTYDPAVCYSHALC